MGIDLSINTILFICQVLGKTQRLLKMFNSFINQPICFIRILSYGLFKITIAKPILNITLLCDLSIFIRNSIPSLVQLFNRFSVFSLIK